MLAEPRLQSKRWAPARVKELTAGRQLAGAQRIEGLIHTRHVRDPRWPGARGPTNVGADTERRICSGRGSANCQARTWLWPWIWWDLFYMMVCLNPQKVGWIVQSVRGPTMCSGVWVWIPKDTICIQTLRLSAGEPAQILLVVRGIN